MKRQVCVHSYICVVMQVAMTVLVLMRKTKQNSD